MKKLLITGAAGFVSRHLLNYLSGLGGYQVLGIDSSSAMMTPVHGQIRLDYVQINMLDYERLRVVIEDFRPEEIIHLASFSSVALSWENPVECFRNNTNIFLNLLDVVRQSGVRCRILSVGSSEEYGKVTMQELPLKENTTVKPLNPYAVARVSQEMLSKIYVEGYGLDIIMTRSFNHVGPGQNENFFIPSVTRQIIQSKHKNAVVKVGDLDIVRDFIDVRDVVQAYIHLLANGEQGELYNVCTGVASSLKSVLSEIIKLSGKNIQILTDPSRIRPLDNPVIVGSNEKIKIKTGWSPNIPLKKSLFDVYHQMQSQA